MTVDKLEKLVNDPETGISKANLVPDLDEETLSKIKTQVLQGYQDDLASMEDWLSEANEIMELIELKGKRKDFPIEKASNIKMPLITTACMQFAARTSHEVIKNDRAVKHKVIGFEDPEGLKIRKGQRVSAFMNYKLLIESRTFIEEIERLLMQLPAIGTSFTKSYYNVVDGTIDTHLVPYNKLIVNNNITSLEKAPRISELVDISLNEVTSGVRQGYYTDIDPKLLEEYDEKGWETMPEFIEQQCYLDLDEDGYSEPYQVIIHEPTEHILRIRPNFLIEDVETNQDGEIIRINKRTFYTDYHFINSANGSFFSLGFGSLLYNTNKAVNSITNQLIDAGTLANTQGGFVNSRLRLNKGTLKFKPGEWKNVNLGPNGTLGDNFYSLDYKEPSTVLLGLMQFLVQSSKELTSTTEALTGQMDGQNTSPVTLMNLIKEGMRVLTAVQKKVNRGLQKNYALLYELYAAWTTPEEYFNVLDVPEQYQNELLTEDGELVDFQLRSLDFAPISDFTASTEALKMVQSRGLKELQALNPGYINPVEVIKFDLESLEISDPVRFINPEPAPDPKGLMKQADIRIKELELQIKMMEAEARVEKDKSQAIKNIAEAEAAEAGPQLDQYKAELDFISKGVNSGGTTGTDN